jgi:hypothetical protein
MPSLPEYVQTNDFSTYKGNNDLKWVEMEGEIPHFHPIHLSFFKWQ